MTQQQTEIPKFERQLIGRRVSIRSFDWKQQLSGTLVKVEKYLYILQLDKGGTLGLHKHACGGISLAPPLEDKA